MTKRLRLLWSQFKSNSFTRGTKKRWFLIVFVCLLLALASIIYILGSLGVLPGTWGNALAALFAILSAVPPLVDRLLPKKDEHLPSSTKDLSITSLSPPSTVLPNIYPISSSVAHTANISSISPIPSPVFLVNMPLPVPDEFYGRERERMKLVERTRHGVCTSLVGARRIGKTWLITYLRQTDSLQSHKKMHISSLDVSLPSCATVSGFTTEVLRTLGLAHIVSSTQPNLALLEEIVKEITAKREQLVLCIDEFEGFAVSPHEFNLAFFTGLRALTQLGLCLVTVSKNPLIDIVSGNTKTSPFFNVFLQIRLGPFNQHEAESFVCAKGKQAQFTQEEQEIMLRYGKAGKSLLWPPLKLQLVGEILLEDKRFVSSGGTPLSLPRSPRYWQKFRERLDETYHGMEKS